MSGISNEYEASKRALRRYLGRFLARSRDVEDMLQEVFVRAYAMEARRPILLPRAYLFRVAKHVALNEIARRKNSATDSVEDFAQPDVIGRCCQANALWSLQRPVFGGRGPQWRDFPSSVNVFRLM